MLRPPPKPPMSNRVLLMVVGIALATAVVLAIIVYSLLP
jgi:hypothetical protein